MNGQTFWRAKSTFTSFMSAFTLAETLIVIGILGVVAALTLPNLNHATGDKEKITRVYKMYSALTDAVDRAQAIYGPFGEWFSDNLTTDENTVRFAQRVSEFMKVQKECGFDDDSASCFDFSNTSPNETASGYSLFLSDGTSVAFYSQGVAGTTKILVDINGPRKGKNMDGIDIFGFDMLSDNLTYISMNQNTNGFSNFNGFIDSLSGSDKLAAMVSNRRSAGNYTLYPGGSRGSATAAQSMLNQANQSNQGVLSLLGYNLMDSLYGNDNLAAMVVKNNMANQEKLSSGYKINRALDDLSSYSIPLSACFTYSYCTGWIVETGNMEYLKTDENGQCSNGYYLSWNSTNCSSSTETENVVAAESTIRDTDMAEEMVEYSNILQQASQSMLAQPNQDNQSVLQLLQ